MHDLSDIYTAALSAPHTFNAQLAYLSLVISDLEKQFWEMFQIAGLSVFHPMGSFFQNKFRSRQEIIASDCNDHCFARIGDVVQDGCVL